MTSVDTLDASQRAVVQLVLKQGKSYGEIADLLGLEAGAVRARAHAALDALGPSTTGLTTGRRADVADYLLDQQSDEDREATRETLASSPAARAWARSVAAELRPVAGRDLPEIPDAAARAAASANGGRRDEDEDEDEPGGGEPLREPGGVRRSSRTGGIVLLAGLAVVVAVVVILLVSGSDDNGTSKTAAASAPANTASAPAQQQTATGAQATPVAQINLHAADGSKAIGVAQVLSQGGQLGFAIVGQNLTPTNKNGAYAVWLYSSPSKAKLLGFVDPPVGQSGKFQNVIAVPQGANQYSQLIVTRESGQPKRPGQIVLAGRLAGVG
jgi:anti-sigma-K factor RskA/sigma-70-like protein